MRNKIIIPENSVFSPVQRSKIRDIWGGIPIGIRAVHGRIEFPDLMVSPTYDGGRVRGKDARYLALKPSEGIKFEIVAVEKVAEDFQRSNTQIDPQEIIIERGNYFLKEHKGSDRYCLTTRVAPKRCEMTYNAIIDICPEDLQNVQLGRIWASEKIKEKEEETQKLILESGGGFF